ncbi:MAG: DUF2336 domain-containing protein [Rhizobiales bacterium]|nr:DUF2336 domain-containing protein [Hyphomicrobiales bacterium]
MGDFLKWAESAPPAYRADAAFALARAFLADPMDEETRHAIEAVLTILLDDSSPDVRRALADALSDSEDSPRHIILALAADQVEIAATVLGRSPVFIDEELVDVVAAADERLQIAIASRPGLSGAVAAAIAEVGELEACRTLIRNGAARVARISLRRMAERFGDAPEMRELMLARRNLPADVRQFLVRRLSEALGELVAVKAWVPEERAKKIARDACDRATVAIAAETESDDLPALVEHLRITGQLTTALLLRAVCARNVGLFETALAVLARVPESRVTGLVRAGRTSSLRAVYGKAGLPAVAFDAFAAALDTCRRIAGEGGPRDRYRFTRHMVESVLARYHHITDGEMNELTGMLRRFAADQAREAARELARSASAAAAA